MVSNIPFGSYQPEWEDYVKTYSSIFDWNFRKVTLHHLPSIRNFRNFPSNDKHPRSILCAKHKNASWVFSWGDFFLESLLCAQRLWILNLFWADTELWAQRFDWLKDYNFWTFQMLFIASQNPVTSAREFYRLLPAMMLSLFSFS